VKKCASSWVGEEQSMEGGSIGHTWSSQLTPCAIRLFVKPQYRNSLGLFW